MTSAQTTTQTTTQGTAQAVPVPVVARWTGRQVAALQMALRMTNEGFAAYLGTAVRTVAKWHATPGIVPNPELQRALDTVLSSADGAVRARFAVLIRARRCPHRPVRSARRAVRWAGGAR